MTVTVFGYLILISIDFHDFTSPFSPQFWFRLRRYIKHSRQCLTKFPNTSKFVKNTPLRVVFSTLLSVFGNVVKHSLSRLIYYLTHLKTTLLILLLPIVLCFFQEGFCHCGKSDNCTFAHISGFIKVRKNSSDALRLALVTHGPIASSVNSDRKTFRFYSHGIYDDPKCGKLQCQVS